jgi:ankyrin repeat protein
MHQHLLELEVGTDMYQPIYGTWDALLLAAVHGNLAALRDLLAHAAKAPNPKHWINLKKPDHSDEYDYIDIVCSSLARNDLIHSKNSDEITPLQMAVEIGDVTTVSKLLSHGADIHVRDKYGYG